MAPRQLRALLTIPPSSLRRPFLFTTPNSKSSLWPMNRGLEIIRRSYASHRPLSVGAFVIPPTPNLPLTEVPVEQLLESPTPDKTLHADLNALFTRNPATFYHGTSDFYTLKKNTQVPEICILGRSNVGKSTFVNALANRRGNELAHTSAKAGKTRAMNAYGFGPPPPPIKLLAADADVKRTEDMPKHSLFIVDMPGYGHMSLKEWGRNITLYLNKRQAIKGAILLIDGEVGPKQGDLMALEMLSEAGLKTMVVLTKADKAKNEETLKNTCKNLWTFMRDTAATDPDSDWQWDRDFFVTAVGATKKEVGIASVDIARLAVARLAGLVEEKARPEPEYPKSWSGKVVSFDELEMRRSNPTTGPPSVTEPETAKKANLDDSSTWTDLERAARQSYLAQVAQSTPSKPRDPAPHVDAGWAALEQAARTQHEARNAVRVPPPSVSRPSRRVIPSSISRTSRRAGPTPNRRLQSSRGFHTSSACLLNRSRPGPKAGKEAPPRPEKAESVPEEGEWLGSLQRMAQDYVVDVRARSLPGTKKPIESSAPRVMSSTTSFDEWAAAATTPPPQKKNQKAPFNPLVSRPKNKKNKKNKKMPIGKLKQQQREKKREQKRRAVEIAEQRVQTEELRKRQEAEQGQWQAAEGTRRPGRPFGSSSPPSSLPGGTDADKEEGGAEEGTWMDDDQSSFAESFEQIETAQRKLKGKKAKAVAKKQQKKQRMTKDRPKKVEDPFMAKFANIR